MYWWAGPKRGRGSFFSSSMASQHGLVVRFAFVGCGYIASVHLQAMRECHVRSEVRAVVDLRRDRAEEFVKKLPPPEDQQCQIFSSLSEALEVGEFEAVLLMVPHDLHEEMAVQCLRAGKHVLLEKPLAHSVSSCERLVEEAERAETVLMVGENSQYWPEVCKAQELVEKGEIGKVYFAKAHYWESIGHVEYKEGYDDNWKPSHWRHNPHKAGGGVLMDGATHWLRPLRVWLGEVESVIGMVGHPLQMSAVESLAEVLLKFSSGQTASLLAHINMVPMQPMPFFQLFGEKGEITIDGDFSGGMSVRTTEQPEPRALGSHGGYWGTFKPQMSAFLEAVVGRKTGSSSAREAMQEVLVAYAVYKSLVSGRWEAVTVDNVREAQCPVLTQRLYTDT